MIDIIENYVITILFCLINTKYFLLLSIFLFKIFNNTDYLRIYILETFFSFKLFLEN